MARRSHAWTALRAPHRTDDRAVAEVLGALAALGPGATTARVLEELGLGPGSADRVRRTLGALESGGAVALSLTDASRPPTSTAWDVLVDAQEALEKASDALHIAAEAVRAALAKQRKPAPRAVHPTPRRPQ